MYLGTTATEHRANHNQKTLELNTTSNTLFEFKNGRKFEVLLAYIIHFKRENKIKIVQKSFSSQAYGGFNFV